MKTKPLTFVLLVVGLLAACGPLLAHHGNSALNTDRVIVIKNATVAKTRMGQSCTASLRSTRRMKKATWCVGPRKSAVLSAMNQMGWSRNSLKPGDVITVFMFQAKTGNPVGRVNKIVLA